MMELRAVLDLIAAGTFSHGDSEVFRLLVDNIRSGAPFLVCAGYPSYINCRKQVSAAWQDRESWTTMSILNSAHSGKVSSDRAIAEYCDGIRNVWPLTVKLTEQNSPSRSMPLSSALTSPLMDDTKAAPRKTVAAKSAGTGGAETVADTPSTRSEASVAPVKCRRPQPADPPRPRKPFPWRWVAGFAVALLVGSGLLATGIGIGHVITHPGYYTDLPADGGPTVDNTLPWSPGNRPYGH